MPDAPPIEMASRGPVNTGRDSEQVTVATPHPRGRYARAADRCANQHPRRAAIDFRNQQLPGHRSNRGQQCPSRGDLHRWAAGQADCRFPGSDTSFNVSFTMFGKEATIRAYGVGNNYVESSIDLSTANGAVYGSNPPARRRMPTR